MTPDAESPGLQTLPIPRWAIVVAAAVFLVTAAGLLIAFRTHERNPPPMLFQIPFSFFMAFFPALWVLVAGAVSRDARRRDLNATLWTLIALLTPMALGVAVYVVYVYQLDRHQRPWPTACLSCGALARPGAAFCTHCGTRLRQACPACGGPVADGDAYCAGCGQLLER
jgi:peptidoglycan/LPS O-acetylase OafA/YrhL